MTALATTEADWLAWRRLGLGASDVASIAGIEGAFSSPYAVWAERVGLVPPREYDDGTLELFQWGHDVEPIVARRFHDETGLHVLGEQTWCEHPTKPWMRATPDGFVCEGPVSSITEALGGFEVKFDRTWSPWDEVPPHYQAQAQWQMAVTGMERTWFGVVHGWRVRFYPFERNEADIAWLTEVAEAFWTDHVLTGVPPDTDGHPATTEALQRAYIADDEADAVDLGELADIVERLRSTKAVIKAEEAAEAELQNRIKALMGDATQGCIAGQKVVTWRAHVRAATDWAAVRDEAPAIVAAHTTTESVRRFLVTPPKKESTRARK